MKQDYVGLENLFDGCTSNLSDYDSLTALIAEILGELPRQSVMVAKETLAGKNFFFSAFPESRLFGTRFSRAPCGHSKHKGYFVLICCGCVIQWQNHMVLNSNRHFHNFVERDEKLASWIIDHMKANLREKMDKAADDAAHSESELLRRLLDCSGFVAQFVNWQMRIWIIFSQRNLAG